MNEYLLFEIPVYIYKEEDYYSKWNLKKNNFIEHQIITGGLEDEAKESFFRCYKYEYLWKYNKIIGFIQIKYESSSGDLKFDIYKQNKKVLYNKINKMKFEQAFGPNLHIFVRKKDNEYIIKQISEKLFYIKSSFFKKHNYIDVTIFNNISKYLDFKKLIEEIDCQK